MKLEKAMDFIAEKIADQIQEMYPDSSSISEKDLDKVMYDVDILNSLQERALDILMDRGFIEDDEEED